jgi:hypothetical protein
MSPRPPLHVVCPVYHEEDNVRRLWAEATSELPGPFVAHFVYDDERDPTVAVLEELRRNGQEGAGRIELVLNAEGGVLNALRAGFGALPAVGRFPVLVMMADLSDELSVVGRMVAEWRRGATVVAARRYMKGGRHIGGPRVKRTLTRLAGKSLYWMGRLPVQDATNNFRLYDADFLRAQAIESRGGFELAMELTVKAVAQGARVVEVPSTWRDRTGGSSKFRLLQWLPHYLRWYAWAYRHI